MGWNQAGDFILKIDVLQREIVHAHCVVDCSCFKKPYKGLSIFILKTPGRA